MALETILKNGDVTLTVAERSRIERYLQALERRLAHHSDPKAIIFLKPFPAQQRVEADLTVQLGHLGQHLISHQFARTPDGAVRLAIDDVERQLERKLAKQGGDHTYGVPSRRRVRTLPETVEERGLTEPDSKPPP